MGAADDLLRQYNLNDPSKTQGLPGPNALGLPGVYMGKTSGRPKKGFAPGEVVPGIAGPTEPPQIDKYLNSAEAGIQPYHWSEQEKSDFIHAGIIRKLPGFSENMGLPDILSEWGKLIGYSTTLGKQGIKMSPMDIMNTYKSREGQTYKKGNWEYDAVTDQPVKYVGPTSRTDTSTKFDISTREDALALAKTSMAQMLGRAPTQDELGNYLNTLNGYERANPTQSTTTTQISPETGEAVSSSSVATGGVSQAGRAAVLEQEMQKKPEYASYQAASTYYGAMMQELMRGY